MNIIHFSKNDGFSQEIQRKTKDVVIAISDQNISVHQVTLPKMSNSRAIKAIPYALESQLLDDIDLLEFTPIKSSKKNVWDVFVTSKEILKDIETYLNKSKCRPAAIVPEFMLLPFSEGSIHYHENDGLISFRSGINQGGCLDKQTFHALFTESSLIETNFSDTIDTKVNIQISIPHKGLSEYLGPWRMPAAIGLIVILVSSSQIWLNNQQLNVQLIQFKTNNEKQFRFLFPDVDRVVNIRVQAKQKLSEAAEKQSNFQNDLLGKLASEVLPNSKVRKITFDNQILTLEVSQ